MKILKFISIVLILSMLYISIGGMFAKAAAERYVNKLKLQDINCTLLRTSGALATRKIYWKCDNGEVIIWWGITKMHKWWFV